MPGGVTRCGEHESAIQTTRKLIDRLGINENRVLGKIPPYHRLKAQLKFCTHFSSRGRFEGRVDTNINRNSRGISGHLSLENVFLQRKTTFELALKAERGLQYSYRMADRRMRSTCDVRSSNIITMDTEL